MRHGGPYKPQPETGCLVPRLSKAIACDDYILEDGFKSDMCCRECGWNPYVQDKRKEKVRAKYTKRRKVNANKTV